MLSLVPTMPRHVVSQALAVLSGTFVLLAFAGVGQAQLTVTVNQVQGRDVGDRPLTAPILFNATDCDDKELELTIGAIPVGTTVLDFWRGTGCDQVEPRTSTVTSACTYLFSLTSFMTPASQLWNDEIQVSRLGGCTVGADNTAVDVYILAATMMRTPEVITSSFKFSTRFDLVAPAPPTGLSAGSGSTAVPVTWTRSSGIINGYRVYVGTDATSSEGGACGGGGLVAGALPPAGARLAVTTSASGGSADLNLVELGLEVGESVSVGVTARDEALNDGVLSEIVCVTRVETCGYLCQRGGDVSTCSAAPGTPRAAGGLGVALLSAALLLLARARRSRGAR